MRRRIVSLLVLVGLMVSGWFAYQRIAVGGPAEVKYTTREVERGRVTSTVTASGTLSPRKTVLVGSQVSGRITELLVDFNDPVKKDQVIARIDPATFSSDVGKAKANLVAARANLTKAKTAEADAKLTDTRSRGLVQQGVLAQAESDAARAAYDSAKASVTAAVAAVDVAQAALDQAKVSLGYTTIVSPIDGVVISRDVDVGQTVAASLSAPTLFTIAEDLRAMEVHTSVAESDIAQLAPDQAVELTVDAFPGRTFPGTVKQIRNAATTVSNVVTYDAVISVVNDPQVLRPGMTANVAFVIADREDALTVPSAALRFTPANAKVEKRGRGHRTVWVMRDGAPAAVDVEIGITDGKATEVTGGELKEGDLVITGSNAAPSAAAAQPSNPLGGNNGGGNRRRGGGGF